eukprot:SAG22_NODE_158_length_16966_cov_26.252446_2_plen_618_part_00
MAAIRLVVWGFLWVLMCGCAGGAVDLQDLSAFAKRLDSLEQQLQEERQDKAALRAELADERRKNKAREQENQLLVGQVAGLQAMLHQFSNKTEANVQKMSARLDQCETDTHPFIREMERRRAQGAAGGAETVHIFKRTISSVGHISGHVDESNGGHRLLTEEGADCSSAEISRQIDAINVECCDEPTEDCSGGKVNTCNAGCGAMIVPFWTACQAQLTRDISKMLRDAVALCPPPDVPVNSMNAQMFMVTCPAGLPADDCIPLCEAQTHGFLLMLNIDGTDTTLTCSLSDLLYSWVGAAALGGFLGQNVAAFVSAVISGAAGTYVLTLMENADVGTDLVIQPGQNVIITGDAGLAEAPRWGSGGFTVGEMGSLSLAFLTLASAISASLGANQLSVTDCVLVGGGTIDLQDVAAVFTNTDFGGHGLSSSGGGSVSVMSCSGELASISVTGGGIFSIATSSGSIGSITVIDSTFMLDSASTVRLVGNILFNNSGEVTLSEKVFSGTSIEVDNSTCTMISSTVLATGMVGAVGNGTINIIASRFESSRFSATDGSSFRITTSSGSINSITMTDAVFLLDAPSTTIMAGSILDVSGKSAVLTLEGCVVHAEVRLLSRIISC